MAKDRSCRPTASANIGFCVIVLLFIAVPVPGQSATSPAGSGATQQAQGLDPSFVSDPFLSPSDAHPSNANAYSPYLPPGAPSPADFPQGYHASAAAAPPAAVPDPNPNPNPNQNQYQYPNPNQNPNQYQYNQAGYAANNNYNSHHYPASNQYPYDQSYNQYQYNPNPAAAAGHYYPTPTPTTTLPPPPPSLPPVSGQSQSGGGGEEYEYEDGRQGAGGAAQPAYPQQYSAGNPPAQNSWYYGNYGVGSGSGSGYRTSGLLEALKARPPSAAAAAAKTVKPVHQPPLLPGTERVVIKLHPYICTIPPPPTPCSSLTPPHPPIPRLLPTPCPFPPNNPLFLHPPPFV
ncbi:uncharacterized protein LOC143294374 [Babylonia areolata]|uniref:uncharacterized protein LOC143294374 n=1 Tax=Babylonia areolata TaxID=304850 RepID=UPI003FD58FB1